MKVGGLELAVKGSTQHPSAEGLWAYELENGLRCMGEFAPDGITDNVAFKPKNECFRRGQINHGVLELTDGTLEEQQPMSFAKWPKIEGLQAVNKEIRYNMRTTKTEIEYRAKTKLHGTNAGVHVFADGKVVGQSRTRNLSTEKDNSGFAAWVTPNEAMWSKLPPCVVYGEWCGSKINANDAITQVGGRHFCVFAIARALNPQTDMSSKDYYISRLIVEPNEIEQFLGETLERDDIHVIPWATEPQLLKWLPREPKRNTDGSSDVEQQDSSGDEAQDEDPNAKVLDDINAKVEAISTRDEWVYQTFNVEGPGEGYVFYPVSINGVSPKFLVDYSTLMFKAKVANHQVVKQKAPVQMDTAVARNIEEFTTMFVTPARVKQGITEVGGFDPKATGKFVQWITQDVLEESKNEVEASGLNWKKQLAPAVRNAAKKMWFNLKNSM